MSRYLVPRRTQMKTGAGFDDVAELGIRTSSEMSMPEARWKTCSIQADAMADGRVAVDGEVADVDSLTRYQTAHSADHCLTGNSVVRGRGASISSQRMRRPRQRPESWSRRAAVGG